ncbi:hypothetical protein KY289_016437 [Solanum tuberosum]|nr:hypothetical protein KY289_016437 [Solanum tuberosum]
MITDAFGGCTQSIDIDVNERVDMEPNLQENATHTSGNQSHQEIDKFEQLMKEANEELYPGSKDMINEKKSNSEGSTDQPPHRVSWKGNVYSHVLGNERSGYVRGLGLGSTPSVLWGSRSFLEKIDEEDSSNEIVQSFPTLIVAMDK